MVSLALPEELLLEVLSYLALAPAYDDELEARPLAQDHDAEERLKLRTLLAVCLTCKRNYRVANPLLYRTIDFPFLGTSGIRPQALLETLLTNWHLRGLIRTLRLPRPACTCTGKPVRVCRLSISTLAEASVYAAPIGSDLRQRLLRRYRSDNPITAQQLVLSLILVLCTNLRVLRIDYMSSAAIGGPISEVVDEAHLGKSETDRHTRPLQQLSHIIIGHSDPEHDGTSTSLVFWAGVLRLPNLQVLTAYRTTSYWDLEFWMRMQSLRSITLFEADIDGEGLGNLLQTCPALLQLCITLKSNERRHVDYSLLGQALRIYGTNLEVLRLYPDPSAPIRTKSLHRTSLMGLGELHQLRSLSVGFEMLVPSEVHTKSDRHVGVLANMLPVALKDLEIVGFPVDSDDGLEGYAMRAFDVDLVHLLADESNHQLHSVVLHRSTAFTQTATLLKLGWQLTRTDDPDDVGSHRTFGLQLP